MKPPKGSMNIPGKLSNIKPVPVKHRKDAVPEVW